MVVIYSSAASEHLIEQPADLDNQARQSQDLREGHKIHKSYSSNL